MSAASRCGSAGGSRDTTGCAPCGSRSARPSSSAHVSASADLGAATAFYGQAFGWLVSDLGYGTAIRVPGYGDHLESTVDPDIRRRQAFAPEGFEDVIGALVPLGPGQSPHWHVTFTVTDRDDAATTAERLGGTVLEQHESEWTRRATIRDPQGAVFTASQFTPPTP